MVFKQEYVGLKQFVIQSVKLGRSWDSIHDQARDEYGYRFDMKSN